MRQVDQGNALALIPAIAVVELTLLREGGRRVIGPAEVQSLIAIHPNFEILPLDLRQATEFMLLGALNDPFDRLVVAAARVSDATLLTADERITTSGLAAIAWD